MGSWSDMTAGSVWSLNIETMAAEKIYTGGRLTHGLAIDQMSRIYIGNANEIVRVSDTSTEVVISGLTIEGNHPLTHFILLPNNDIAVNIGAPSDACKEEMGEADPECPTRELEGEVRLYSYLPSLDAYHPDYKVLGRGLRNSMALLHNSVTKAIYQAENNIDLLGTPEEFNVIPLLQEDTLDFGWPFFAGLGEQTPFVENYVADRYRDQRTDPLFLIPNHSSPLDMTYYYGSLSPSVNSSILMSWHGHRRAEENALVAYPLNDDFSPVVSSAENNNYITVLSGINQSTGEKIRPVGVTSDLQGRIWFVDDKTKRLYIFDPNGNVAPTNQDSTGPSLTEQNQILVDEMTQEQLTDFDSVYSRFHSVQTCSECHGEGEFPVDSKQALLSFLNKGWLSPVSENDPTPFIERMDPNKASPRSMPPQPALPFGESHPEIFEDLKRWVEQNLS